NTASSNGSLPPLNEGELKTLAALASLGNMAHSRSWREATGFSERTFHRHRGLLVEKGYVKENEMNEQRSWYHLTDAGTATAKRLPSAGQDSEPTTTAATATPPIGVAGAAGVADGNQHETKEENINA